MPRWLFLLLFAPIAIGIVVLVHYYLWRRLVRDTYLPHPWRRVLTIAIALLGASIPLTLMTTRLLGARLGLVLGWPVFLWLGMAMLLFVGFLFVDAVRMARWSVRYSLARARRNDRPLPEPRVDMDPERRQFFARVAGGAVATAAVGVSGFGVHQALREHDIEEVPITLPRLPRELDGFTIVQLSDIHVGLTVTRAYVQSIVDRANRLEPDLMVITGDLVDGDVPTLRDAAAPLAGLRAPHGVYFVTGNHDYYSGADEWIEEITRLGIRVLLNEHVSIGHGEHRFDLAGITDPEGARYSERHAPDLARALAGRDPSRALILLAHQPRQVLDTEGHGVGLQLSGHTHGGQIWPWHYLVKLQQRGFLAGLQRHGDTLVYTSRGTGYWGPPLRVGAPPEITRLILRAERHA